MFDFQKGLLWVKKKKRSVAFDWQPNLTNRVCVFCPSPPPKDEPMASQSPGEHKRGGRSHSAYTSASVSARAVCRLNGDETPSAERYRHAVIRPYINSPAGLPSFKDNLLAALLSSQWCRIFVWRTCKERDRQKPGVFFFPPNDLIPFFVSLFFCCVFFFFSFHAFDQKKLHCLCFSFNKYLISSFYLVCVGFYVSKFELTERNPSFYSVFIQRFVLFLFPLPSFLCTKRTSLTFNCRNGKSIFLYFLCIFFFYIFLSRLCECEQMMQIPVQSPHLLACRCNGVVVGGHKGRVTVLHSLIFNSWTAVTCRTCTWAFQTWTDALSLSRGRI